jgi:hypothetical protein
MSLLHRTRAEDDVVVDRDRVQHDTNTAITPSRTRERSWTFAPGQLVSLAVGVGFIAVGVIAMIRAGIDGSFETPAVDVLRFSHTAWLGLAEVGLGLLLLLAGTGAWGRPLSVLLGAAMLVAGVLVLAEPGQMPDELGLEKDYGWPLIGFGALVALAAMVLPVWRSHRVDHEELDLRDDHVRPAHRADLR